MGRPRKHPVNGTNTPIRPKRIPMDGYRNTLTFDDRDPNFVYRVFNDVDGRIQRAEQAGYEVVTAEAELGDPTADSAASVGSAVTKPVGGGVTGVLMRIPREWYKEDQALKQKRADQIEEALREGPTKEGQYGKVEITRR